MMSMSGAPKRRSSWLGDGRSRGEIGMASLNRDGGTSCVLYIPISGCRERYREGSMANRVVHFEIIHPEAAQIQKFFADVFDWAINTANPMNYGIQGGIAAPGPFGDGHITFYVEVDDVDAALAKAVAAGGTIAMPKINIGGAPGQETILAQFTDPLGNRYGLSQRHAQPAPAAAARPARKAAKKAKAKPKAKAKAKPKAKPKTKAKAKAKKRRRRR